MSVPSRRGAMKLSAREVTSASFEAQRHEV
jgi:hypothetical protein